eukprot:TRINITY_DN6841_c0_g1_i1.p1 TRINITY_DN6841_c0_g1~~TRINITY_DN6841_c0_g1_i1.p1  ORF type:complete len:589 (-),score=108.06 TRINITY_DN6841_c0_g1_i1:32-1705(-)
MEDDLRDLFQRSLSSTNMTSPYPFGSEGFQPLHSPMGPPWIPAEMLTYPAMDSYMQYPPEHPGSTFISDQFEIAKGPFLSAEGSSFSEVRSPNRQMVRSDSKLGLQALQNPPEFNEAQNPPHQNTAKVLVRSDSKLGSHSEAETTIGIKDLKVEIPRAPSYSNLNSILSPANQSPIPAPSESHSTDQESWFLMDSPQIHANKKGFNERCYALLTDLSVYSHPSPPIDIIKTVIKGRQCGAYKIRDAESENQKESWKKDGHSWDQKGGWHTIFGNKLKRKTFTLHQNKNWKKSVTKLADLGDDQVIVSYFYHGSELKIKKRKSESLDDGDCAVAQKYAPPAKQAKVPMQAQLRWLGSVDRYPQPTLSTEWNPQEEILDQEMRITPVIFQHEKHSVSIQTFWNALHECLDAFSQMTVLGNGPYDIPGRGDSFISEDIRPFLAKYFGRNVCPSEFQRFWRAFGPAACFGKKVNSVYNMFFPSKEEAEAYVLNNIGNKAIYLAPEPMCLVLAVCPPNSNRVHSFLLRNSDAGVQFQLSRSLWSTSYRTVTEMLDSNEDLWE